MAAPQYVPLEFKPGVWKNGTLYQARGRWYDSDLMRWNWGAMGPIGGWRSWGYQPDAAAGTPRTCMPWVDNSNNRWMAVGSHSKLYVYDDEAAQFDITPTSFVSGNVDADPDVGYGDWLYGRSTYNEPRPDIGTPTPATIWALDNWGEDLTGCTPDDGKLYLWDASAGTGTRAAAITAKSGTTLIPTKITSTLVTPERIQMCFGGTLTGGAKDERTIFWSEIEDNTDWTATATNHAGDHQLESTGDLLGGVRVPGRILIFTTEGAHTAQYVGLPYVYQFNEASNNCGPVSLNAVAVAGTTAYWMGRSAFSFFKYDGYVQPIPCDVQDYVVSTINQGQSSKVVAWHNELYSEIVWFYPNGEENDRYVSFNYQEEHWSVGTVARTAASSRGVFSYPILFDASGNPYEHEVGGTYKDVGETAKVPYVESGPIEIGNGNRVMSATSLIPDVTSLGDITTTFYTRFYPTDSDTSHGPYTMTAPTPVRFTGRTVRMRCTSDSSDNWRVGVPRLQLKAGGQR
tara:strand:+ start:783 stop:2327 length:1545 start_codon:yes stop_codon:yes gene_type:complete